MGCPGIFDISDRFEKLYLSEVFLLRWIEAEIKLPVVGSVSYLAAAVGAAAIYYLWSNSSGLPQSFASGIPATGALPGR